MKMEKSSRKKRVFSLLVGFSLVLGCSLPAFAETDYSYAIYSLLNNSSTGIPAIYSKIDLCYQRLHSYLPSLSDIKSASQSIDSKLSSTNNYLQSLSSTASVISSYTQYIYSRQNDVKTGILSGMNVLDGRLVSMQADVAQLKEVLASDEDLAMRQDMQNRQDSINSSFISSSGGNSMKLSDVSDLSSASTAVTDALTSGASASDAFGAFSSSSDAWGWFSNDVASNLDTTTANNRNMLRSSGSGTSDTPFLDRYYSDIASFLGVSE